MAGWCGRQSSASGSTKARWAARQTRSACASAKPGVRLYCRRDGSPRRVGEVITNPDYAATLALIAAKGAAVFYEGAIADLIAEDFARNEGLLSPDDLASYRPKCALPLMGTYRDHRVATNQPPGGGVMLIEMLNILEEFDLAGLGHNTPGYIRVVAEAMKRATIDKDRFVGDPAFTAVPLERLDLRTYAEGLAGEIRRGERAEVPRLNAAPPPASETTQLSVVDRDGNCVSMTHSLGMPSGVITEGLGFMYNGCMGVFDPRPGRAGSIAPGKARFTAMCPTIVLKGNMPFIVIGAPGGTQIVMGVLQAILNIIDFGMSMPEAVAAPRFSATSNAIDVSNRIPRFVTSVLEYRRLPCAAQPTQLHLWLRARHLLPRRNARRRCRPGPRRRGALGLNLSQPRSDRKRLNRRTIAVIGIPMDPRDG